MRLSRLTRRFKDQADRRWGRGVGCDDNILAAGKRSKTLEIEGKKVDRDEAEAELVAVMDARGYQDNAADRGAMSAVQRLMKNATSLTGSARAMMRVVETWALTMDDGKAGGPFTKYLVRPCLTLWQYFTAQIRMDDLADRQGC